MGSGGLGLVGPGITAYAAVVIPVGFGQWVWSRRETFLRAMGIGEDDIASAKTNPEALVEGKVWPARIEQLFGPQEATGPKTGH